MVMQLRAAWACRFRNWGYPLMSLFLSMAFFGAVGDVLENLLATPPCRAELRVESKGGVNEDPKVILASWAGGRLSRETLSDLVTCVSQKLSKEPQDRQLLKQRAFFYSCLAQLDEARADGRLGRSHLERGATLSDARVVRMESIPLDQAGGARKPFACNSVAAQTDCVQRLVVLGAVYLAQGQNVEAVIAYTKALEFKDDLEARWGRSLALERLGLRAAAWTDRQRVFTH